MSDITAVDLGQALAEIPVDIDDRSVSGYAYIGWLRNPEAVAERALAILASRGPLPVKDDRPGPAYYKGAGGMQPFDVIDAFGLDFYEGNVVKYLVRWRRKNGLEDLRKARRYMDEVIRRAEADDAVLSAYLEAPDAGR